MRFCQSLMFADPAQWVELARHAEEVGFDQVALSDHVFYPESMTSVYPYTPDGTPLFPPDTAWPDVWVMVGAMASVTSRITFTTNVYVLPLRNPFVVAKAVGTAAFLTGDRVSLGIGAGWMKEEFDQLEQPFARRGKRMDEQVEVLRKLWQGGLVEHHGEFYDFDKLQMAPVPSKPVPIIVGGHSEIALRRAAQRGDEPFDVQASIIDAPPTADVVAQLEGMGVTTLLTSAWMMEGLTNASLDDNKRALDSFAERYIEPLR